MSKWTEEELNILEECYKKHDTLKEIFAKLPGKTESAIRGKAHVLRLPEKYQTRKHINVDDFIGKRFGRWVVLSDVGLVDGRRIVHCRCDCGTERDVDLRNLRSGISKSCGCYHDEVVAINGKANKAYNEYDMDSEEYGIGWTRNGYEFLFDKEDYDIIKDLCWHKHRDGYPRTCYDSYCDENNVRHNKYIMMHQLLSKKYFDGKMLDHINGRTNDNRKENLRSVTRAENMKNAKLSTSNKSGHKGVYMTPSGMWAASIQADNVYYNLGKFSDFEDAVRAREEAEKRLFGEFSRDKKYL